MAPILVVTGEHNGTISQQLEALGYLCTKIFSQPPDDLRDFEAAHAVRKRIVQHDGVVLIDEFPGGIHALELLAGIPPEWPGHAVILTRNSPHLLPTTAVNLESGATNGALPGLCL